MEKTKKLVIEWAAQRGLLDSKNAHAQTVKLLEECGELAHAILKDDFEAKVDAIGDIQVVLIILAHQIGVNYDVSLDIAYDEIKARTGKMVNGSFVKDENQNG